jgi:hypothetical protein
MTAINVLRQFLDAIAILGHSPQLVRSDHRKETLLIADAQLQIRRVKKPELPFNEAVAFGRSYENQRIKAWWTNLTKSSTSYWMVCLLYLLVRTIMC